MLIFILGSPWTFSIPIKSNISLSRWEYKFCGVILNHNSVSLCALIPLDRSRTLRQPAMSKTGHAVGFGTCPGGIGTYIERNRPVIPFSYIFKNLLTNTY